VLLGVVIKAFVSDSENPTRHDKLQLSAFFTPTSYFATYYTSVEKASAYNTFYLRLFSTNRFDNCDVGKEITWKTEA
jgi:hypothetical protein